MFNYIQLYSLFYLMLGVANDKIGDDISIFEVGHEGNTQNDSEAQVMLSDVNNISETANSNILLDRNEHMIPDSNLTVLQKTYFKDLVTVIDPLKNSLENLLSSVDNLVSSLLGTVSLLLDKMGPILGRLLAFVVDMLNELVSRILSSLSIALSTILNYLSFLLNYISEVFELLRKKLSTILATCNTLIGNLEPADLKCADGLRSRMLHELSKLENSLVLCNTDLSNALHTTLDPLTSGVKTITKILSSADSRLKECLTKNPVTSFACVTKVISKTFLKSLSFVLNGIKNVMPDVSRNLGNITVSTSNCIEDAFLHTSQKALDISNQLGKCNNNTMIPK